MKKKKIAAFANDLEHAYVLLCHPSRPPCDVIMFKSLEYTFLYTHYTVWKKLLENESWWRHLDFIPKNRIKPLSLDKNQWWIIEAIQVISWKWKKLCKPPSISLYLILSSLSGKFLTDEVLTLKTVVLLESSRIYKNVNYFKYSVIFSVLFKSSAPRRLLLLHRTGRRAKIITR